MILDITLEKSIILFGKRGGTMILEKSIILFGKRGGTRTKEVSKALNDNGIKCADRLTRISESNQLPVRSLVCCYWRTRSGKKQKHWMLNWDGSIYDPGLGKDHELISKYSQTSFLDLTEALCCF